MFYFFCYHQCKQFLLLLTLIIVPRSIFGEDTNVLQAVPEDLVAKLYLKYKEAVEDEAPVATRRLFTQNRQYEIHINKLKEVNGFKKHNLIIKAETASDDNPLIYINNPVESKFPNAYLSLEEFKQTLTERILRQRNMFSKESNNALRTSNTKYLTTKKVKQGNTFTKVSKTALRTSKTKYLTTKKITSSGYSLKKNNFTLKTNKVKGPTKTQTQRKPQRFSVSNPTISTNGNKTNSIEIIHSTITLKPTHTSAMITETIRRTTIQEKVNITESTETEYTTETTTGYEVNATTNSSGTSPAAVHDVSLVENSPESSTIQVVSQEPSTEPTRKEFSTEHVLREVIKTTTKRTRRTLGRPLVFMGNQK